MKAPTNFFPLDHDTVKIPADDSRKEEEIFCSLLLPG